MRSRLAVQRPAGTKLHVHLTGSFAQFRKSCTRVQARLGLNIKRCIPLARRRPPPDAQRRRRRDRSGGLRRTAAGWTGSVPRWSGRLPAIVRTGSRFCKRPANHVWFTAGSDARRAKASQCDPSIVALQCTQTEGPILVPQQLTCAICSRCVWEPCELPPRLHSTYNLRRHTCEKTLLLLAALKLRLRGRVMPLRCPNVDSQLKVSARCAV